MYSVICIIYGVVYFVAFTAYRNLMPRSRNGLVMHIDGQRPLPPNDLSSLNLVIKPNFLSAYA